MPTYIIKLHDERDGKDYYMEWSTVVDAPVTYGLSRKEFEQYYGEEYGDSGMLKLPPRMERVEKTGTSGFPPDDDLEELIAYNRAGEQEACLTKIELIDKYCINKPK
jgi:hypothetical protein